MKLDLGWETQVNRKWDMGAAIIQSLQLSSDSTAETVA
jgi:hypothetical protein